MEDFKNNARSVIAIHEVEDEKDIYIIDIYMWNPSVRWASQAKECAILYSLRFRPR